MPSEYCPKASSHFCPWSLSDTYPKGAYNLLTCYTIVNDASFDIYKSLFNFFTNTLLLPQTTVVLSGMSLVITQFWPIITLLPILTQPIILVPAPIKTLLPITAHPSPGFLWPIKTPG